MNFNKAIITFVASANAIKIQSKVQSQDVWSDMLDFGGDVLEFGWDATTTVIGFGLDTTANMVNSGLAVGEYIISDDGLIEDLEYVFSADFGEDLLDVGDAIITGQLFVDGYNWMADGDNWEALLKVGLGTGMSLVQGDVEQAWNTATNWDLYDGDTWDPETHYREAYENYKQQYNAAMDEQMEQIDGMRASKAENCSKMEVQVGEAGYKLYGVVDVNYTLNVSAQVGASTMSKFYQYYGGSPTQEQCEQADCLHPCYGASHESNCNLCFQIAFVKDVNEKFTTEQFQQICGACSVPPKEIELPPMMTYEEFKVYAEEQQKKQ